MGTFSLDNTQVDTGPFVLSVSPSSLLLLDDDRGQRDSTSTGQLMATVAGGDRAAVLSAMRDAREDFENAVAIVADAERTSAFLFGSMIITAETAGARITVTALDGQVDEIPMPSTLSSLTITPEGSIPLRAEEGAAPSSTAVRAARVRVEVTPGVTVPPVPVVPPAVVEEQPAPKPEPAPAPPAAAEPAPAPAPAPPAPAAEPEAPAAPPEDVELIDLAPDAQPSRESLPVDDAKGGEVAEADRVKVLGVRCPRDHHNHPDAVYCAQCGLRMGVNQTLIANLGPRPALGLLLLDDGSTHPIDTDLIVGREPHFHEQVVGGEATDLAIHDPDLNLSREHFVIRLVDWDVTAMDLNSSNGTLVQRHQTVDWVPLSTTETTMLRSGDKLRAGSRIFQIQLHHIQG